MPEITKLAALNFSVFVSTFLKSGIVVISETRSIRTTAAPSSAYTKIGSQVNVSEEAAFSVAMTIAAMVIINAEIANIAERKGNLKKSETTTTNVTTHERTETESAATFIIELFSLQAF